MNVILESWPSIYIFYHTAWSKAKQGVTFDISMSHLLPSLPLSLSNPSLTIFCWFYIQTSLESFVFTFTNTPVQAPVVSPLDLYNNLLTDLPICTLIFFQSTSQTIVRLRFLKFKFNYDFFFSHILPPMLKTFQWFPDILGIKMELFNMVYQSEGTLSV